MDRPTAKTSATFVTLAFLRVGSGFASAEILLPNGDFEAGNTVWTQSSNYQPPQVVHESELPVPPASGSWAAWLGGLFDEVGELSQVIVVPASHPVLRFESWIATDEIACGFDFAQVRVDGEVLETFDLCSENESVDWETKSIDLSSVAGEKGVEVMFRIVTDDVFDSSLFLDDVRFFDPDSIFEDGFESGGPCEWSFSSLPCS